MSVIPATEYEREIMGLALGLAHAAAADHEVPVGAVVVDATGRVIGSGRNMREQQIDPTAHAEVLAIRAAAEYLGTRVLEGCTLVVTLEPCVMCAGVLLAARISKVVFGAWDEKAGAAGSVYDLLRDGRLPSPVPEVVGGILEAECVAPLEAFFRARRSSGSR